MAQLGRAVWLFISYDGGAWVPWLTLLVLSAMFHWAWGRWI